MNTVSEPRLDAPGAGLPKLELYAARLMFRRFRKKHNPESLNDLICTEKSKILKRVETIDEKRGMTRVLIDRIRGLEDSSRYWSVYMTLEHVRIVNSLVADTMASLANGKIPDRAASTAEVKPDDGIGRSVLAEFAASCDKLISCIDGIKDLDRTEKLAHPWFGPLGIRDWHALAAVHFGIHRKQIKKILENLNN